MKAKIQVAMCSCCVAKPELLDVPSLQRLALETENVVSAVTLDGLCDGANLPELVKDAREKEADRAVVLACWKDDVSPALLKAYRRAGVDPSLVAVVNLREQVVLPHPHEQKRAQAKAEAMLRAAVADVRMREPLETYSEDMRTRNVVIIGAGVAGQAAAEVAAKEGAHTVMIEKSGRSVKAPGVILPNTEVIGGKGYGGNFTLTIRAGGKIEGLDCAAVVIASGGGWATMKGPLAKAVKDAVPLYTLNERMQAGQAPQGPVVIVDTPDPSGKNMRVLDYAWEDALRIAISIKKLHPETEVYLLFQEMRAFGLSELEYKEAAEIGVRFVRYDRASPPKADPKEPGVIAVKDLAQGEVLRLKFGTLAFASIPANRDNAGIADALRISLTADGGLRRGSIQRGPVSTPRQGVFVCGSALFPKTKDMAEQEGRAAGAMAAMFAKKGRIDFGGVVAKVAQEKCSACLTCVRTCPYEAPFIGTASKAEIRLQLCQGCGTCVGICPSKAIELLNRTDDQIAEVTRALLGGGF